MWRASIVSIINAAKLNFATMVPLMCWVFSVMFFTTTMTVKAGESSEEAMEVVKACISLANPEVAKCCSLIEDMGKDKKEKCNAKDGEMTCDNAKCFLQEDGLDGNNIDLELANQKLEEFVNKHSELQNMGDTIKKNCFDDRKFEQYPPEDCPAASLILCTYMNSIIECPEWKNSDQCQKFAEDAKTCKKAIDSM